jgi:hypothetical protein
MAGIKNINVISGTGNPVQMQDLQNLWSAINSLLRSTQTPISIVAGFATANNDTGTNIGEGIICYQGQAYYLAADVAKIGQYLYANTIQDEQRVYEDGTTRYTYQDYVVNAAANASASGIGTLIGQATAANLAAWKVGVLSDGSVTAAMLADGAVTTPKLANSAVTSAKIAAETITNEEILNYTINAAYKMVPGSVEEACIATAAVGSRQLQVAAVNTSIIKDGAVTGSKIADDAISGKKIEKGTIPADKMAAPGVIYLEPTTVMPNAILANHKLNIIRIGNIGSTHVNAVMPVQQLPGTPVRIFIEHTSSDNAVVDIILSTIGVVVGNINISSTVRGMYAEIFVYDGRVFYWVSGNGNYQRK